MANQIPKETNDQKLAYRLSQGLKDIMRFICNQSRLKQLNFTFQIIDNFL